MKHITRVFVLPFFLMYALSPIYLTAMNDEAGIQNLHSSGSNVTVGMVWLSFLIDSIAPEPESGSRRSIQEVRAKQHEELVLIKKKRILGREKYQPDPIFQVVMMEHIEAENRVSPGSAFDIPRDLIHNHSDGYYCLSTGLSPPSLLS